ncbi:hypothetical protein CVT25_007506 [Psilocybe cyanescens]|uniref:Uncharacterized protein n=1 Tax=Psilocybe cyanescens TaxID=93625 RepID=A0A409WCI5_PSICY|nr:hypothetical protein CVT25_007506 [Psilocybe cyanescens]
MLFFVEAVFTKREGSPSSADGVSDDVVVTCLRLSTLFSLSVAALRQPPQRNTHVTDLMLRLSFLSLLAGMMISTWGNQRTITSIDFTFSFILLVIMYGTWTDPSPNNDGEGEYPLHGQYDRSRKRNAFMVVYKKEKMFEKNLEGFDRARICEDVIKECKPQRVLTMSSTCVKLLFTYDYQRGVAEYFFTQ